MTQAHRLAHGGRIARDRTLGFTFNGRAFTGHPGDTLASALLANGVMLVGRSFKYHRPRGIYSAGSEEPNALVQLGHGARTTPNVPATRIELYEGLAAASVNCWPSVEFDLGVLNDTLSRLLPAGFYYKTFMWPAQLWMTYEYFIRRMAGLGRAPAKPDPDTYDKMNLHCDVLVVGGGPAGLTAALTAARARARVVLADEQPEFGGRLLDERFDIGGTPALDWVAATVAELQGAPEVTLLSRTTAFGYYDHNFVALLERRTDHDPLRLPGPRQRLWRVRAKEVVLATGAIERPLVFADNDRPGVMLAGAARAYVNRFAVRPGRRAVVFTNNDDAYRTALDLHDAGIAVAAVIDVRHEIDSELPTQAMAKGIPVIEGSAVVAVKGTHRVNGIEIMRLSESGDGVAGDPKVIDCDLVATSGGWNPAIHLHCHSGAKPRYDDSIHAFVPGASVQAERSAGTAAGAFALADCLRQGWEAGRAAALAAGFKPKGPAPRLEAAEPEPAPLRPQWLVPGKQPVGRGAKHFVDLADDVTAADIRLAQREGYESVEHTKRYTTLGMGPEQGKTGGILGLAILAEARAAAIPAVGTTTFRPPYTPVTYGALAGRDVGVLADPVRRTALHHWHETAGAKFEDVGQWRRPWYYPRAGEILHDAVQRECLAVRTAVGILDASTLGKIDLQGPDAVTLLNRVYTNAWDKLAIGRCRYGLMLGEDGMVFDDGVTTRLGERHFLMTTTTGNAARALHWLENWLQTEWTDLKVYVTSVTEQWANVTVCGPNARRLLAEVAPGMDLAPSAFPFMSMRQGIVAGVPARVFRVSFTGEVSFEINVPASAALALWNALMTAGEKYGITPFGTEAMHVLRAEKGYIIVGQETDGTVTPHDLGLDALVSKTKDFLGRRSLSRADTAREGRKQLVGLLTENPREVLPEGAQIVAAPKPRPPMAMIGHVTSSYFSPILSRSIALALLKNGRNRLGEIVHVPLADKTVRATVTKPAFFDPEGTRFHG